MSAPDKPPPLVAMAARTEQLEFERRQLFTLWKAALEAAAGNVTRAAENFSPPMNRHKGNRLTRRFQLVQYAAELRVAATGRSRGTTLETANLGGQ